MSQKWADDRRVKRMAHASGWVEDAGELDRGAGIARERAGRSEEELLRCGRDPGQVPGAYTISGERRFLQPPET